MNRPTPISVFSDQRRTKSTTWSRTSCGTQLPVRVPQVFFLARRAPPSTRPGLRSWSGPSSPRTQSVSVSPPPGDGDAPEPEKQPLRSRRTPFASGRTPSPDQFLTQVRDGHLVQKVSPQDGYFLFCGVMLPFLPHTFAPLS